MEVTAVVVLADGFEEIEAVTPIDLMRRGGIRVITAGLSGTRVVGARGIPVEADVRLADLPGGFDALVLPGGLPGARNLADSPELVMLLNQTVARGAWVAAICAAPRLVLGRHGLLKGRRYTGYPGAGPEVDAGGTEADEAVVVDGRLITSRGVGTAAAWGLELVRRLKGDEAAQTVARAALLA